MPCAVRMTAKKPQIALPSVMSVGRIATDRTRRRRWRSGTPLTGRAGSSNDRFSSLDAVPDLHRYFGKSPARDVQFRSRSELDHPNPLALLEHVVLPDPADDAPRDGPGDLPHEDVVLRGRPLDEDVVPLVPLRALGIPRVEELARRVARRFH